MFEDIIANTHPSMAVRESTRREQIALSGLLMHHAPVFFDLKRSLHPSPPRYRLRAESHSELKEKEENLEHWATEEEDHKLLGELVDPTEQIQNEKLTNLRMVDRSDLQYVTPLRR